jgi:hypothetical protein
MKPAWSGQTRIKRKNFAPSLPFSRRKDDKGVAEENRNARNDQLIKNYMKRTLKIIAMAMLLTAATVTVSRAETMYESLSVNMVLTYQGAAELNDATKGPNVGEITDVAGKTSFTTKQFMQLVATNLHVALSNGASLVRVTSLYPGTNYRTVITNLIGAVVPAGTVLPNGNTVLTNIEVPMTIVWQNNTNSSLFYTNSFTNTPPVASAPTTNNSTVPNNNYTIPYSVTNFTNFVIQGKGDAVVLGSAQYFIHNGSGVNDTNFSDANVWVPLTYTNNNAAVSVSALDEAENFQNIYINSPFYIDDANQFQIGTNFYFGDTFSPLNGQFFMADLVTNLNMNVNGYGVGPIFVGTIKTNMAMTGTLFGDTIYITMGYPFQQSGTTNFLANLSMSGSGNAIATTTTAGKGKSAMPFTSWNVTYDVSGSGWLGGTDENNVNATNYVYSTVSNGLVHEEAGFYEPGVGYTTNTNPPVAFTNSYTYISGTNPPLHYFFSPPPPATVSHSIYVQDVTPDVTGYSYSYSNYTYTNVFTNVYTLVPADTYFDTNLYVTNYTNSTFTLVGTVKQTFVKIGPP